MSPRALSDPSLADARGFTSLGSAKDQGHPEIAQLLESAIAGKAAR